MNKRDLIKNRGLLAIILGVAVIAAVGGLSAVFAASSSNQTQSQTQPQIQGSVNLQQTLMSSVKIPFSAAESTALSSIANGKVIGGSLTVVQGSVVYDFKIVDDKNLVYSVIVDAGDGKVLYTSQGKSMNFGGFGTGHFGGGHCSMGDHGWNQRQAPSGTTSPSSSNTNPTTGSTNIPTESQV